MDVFSAIVVVVPLVVPVAQHFGVDPYHLGVIFLLNLEIGYLTPPVGLNLFIAGFRFGKSITELYRAVLVPIGLLAVVLALVTYVPSLSTWLTSLTRGTEPVSLPLDTAPVETHSNAVTPDNISGEGGPTLDDLEEDLELLERSSGAED